MGKSQLITFITVVVISTTSFCSCAPMSVTVTTAPTVNAGSPSPTTSTIINPPSNTVTTITPATTAPMPTAPLTAPTPSLTSSKPAPSAIPAGSIQVERAFPNLSFQSLTNLVQPNDKNGLIFVTEQKGVIQAFDANHPEQGPHVFLDITNRVNSGGEEGLLGLAFDPDYAQNGRFYVYYSAANPRRTVVSRFNLDQANPSAASPQSEIVILEVAQPFSNHKGGQIVFGPDGYLYIGLGDGGSGGDPQGNGQNLGTLLGKILRINVSDLSVNGNYKIPADNPFVSTSGARAEIWAFGLRNPWRFSFDKETGLLWAGDVGQNMWEEIDIITGGANYGWNIMEGLHCYSPTSGCNQSGLTLPLVEYDHSQGCSVTGGYVYRGVKTLSLRGHYIYGDYCSGNIWALGYQNNTVSRNVLLVDSGLSITSFGEDLSGNLYILSGQGGIYTLVQK
jgi:glucose/arabinose dehydrogenase